MEPGLVFVERYRLDEHVATDRGVATFLATDLTTDARVVLDTAAHRGPASPSRRAELEDAGRAALPLDHDGLGPAEAVGRDHGRYFTVTPVGGGELLAQALARGSELPDDAIIDLIHDVSDALSASHSEGVVHGSLSPATLLLTDQGTVRLIGFGRVHVAPRPEAPTTSDDHRALGHIARTCLSGRLPGPELTPVLRRLEDPRDPVPPLSASTSAASSEDDLTIDDRRVGLVRSLPPAGRFALMVLALGAVAGLVLVVLGLVDDDGPPPDLIAVPDVEGAPEAEAQADLDAAGLVVVFQDQPSDAVPDGAVISQDPAAGSRQPEGERVTVVVSTGGEPVDVPDVVGLSLTEAEGRAAAAGLVVEVQRPGRTNLPPDEVFVQLPSAGDTAKRGERLLLVVAGPAE